MADPLLLTKLHVPQPRPQLVPRPHLIARLNAGLAGKLTLVSAPAGFGKTTLLSAWIKGRDSSGVAPTSAAWLSLDAGDNDVVRFWRYVIAALQTAQTNNGADLLTLLQSPKPPPIESILTELINEIATGLGGDPTGPPNILVLDDYHVIEEAAIHEAVTFLIDHQPPQLHLVIATRVDPPLPLARLRARGQLAELGPNDLRFTATEAAMFLKELMGLDLSADDLAALDERTEGWIAGLQLAALSMQGRDDVSGFIKSFAGSHHYVLDYLAAEVVDRQPKNVRAFLLQTAILDRLSGPLCEAVTVDDAGQAMLEHLEEANLFIVPLDDERRWYRYHNLFADFLRARLEQTQPAQVPELHRRASLWYETNHFWDEAFRHAIAAEDYGRASRLIERQAQAMIMRGEATRLLRRLDALPADLVRSRPQLSLVSALALMITGPFDAFERALQDAESALQVLEAKSPAEARVMRTEVDAIRAIVSIEKGEVVGSIDRARQALDDLPRENVYLRGGLAYSLGLAYRAIGAIGAAGQAFAEAQTISEESNNVLTDLLATYDLAELHVEAGRLRNAVSLLQHALWLIDRTAGSSAGSLPVAGAAHIGLGRVLLERNELEAAHRHLERGVELAEKPGGMGFARRGYVALAFLHQALGDEEQARHFIQRAAALAPQSPRAGTVANVSRFRAELALNQNQLAPVRRWADESQLHVEDDVTYANKRDYIVFARLLIAEGRLEEAQTLLARLLQRAEDAGWTGAVIDVLILQALGQYAHGDTGPAIAAVGQAISLAKPEGYVRIFVDKGQPLAELLSEMAERGPLTDYVDSLLESFRLEGHKLDVAGSSGDETSMLTSSLVEPLTDRELEVLGLIAAGLSNREIGEELVISLGTVKKHTHNIYGKLGVSSRTQAVARARALNLLSLSS